MLQSSPALGWDSLPARGVHARSRHFVGACREWDAGAVEGSVERQRTHARKPPLSVCLPGTQQGSPPMVTPVTDALVSPVLGGDEEMEGGMCAGARGKQEDGGGSARS